MANKKLIQDLKSIVEIRGLDREFYRDVAARALEEIEYLQNQIDEKQTVLDWYDFELGDMK